MNKCTQGLNRHYPKKMCNNQNSCALLVGTHNAAASMENNTHGFWKKLKIELPDDPEIPLLDMYPK